VIKLFSVKKMKENTNIPLWFTAWNWLSERRYQYTKYFHISVKPQHLHNHFFGDSSRYPFTSWHGV